MPQSYAATAYGPNLSALNVLGANSGAQVPTLNSTASDVPNLTFKSAYAIEANTGKVLLDVNSNERLAPASTVKLLTALVALDLYDAKEQLQIPEFCTLVEGTKTGLIAQDYYFVEDLLYSLLVNSGADSACTLANSALLESQFVNLMNFKAKNLGLLNTKVQNPIGLDSVQNDNYSTSADLAILSKESVEQRLIKEIVQTKAYEFESVNGQNHVVFNTNSLLWGLPNSVGIKTGTTDQAGEVLTFQYKESDKNIIIVVMGSEDRFSDTIVLLDWILNAYTW